MHSSAPVMDCEHGRQWASSFPDEDEPARSLRVRLFDARRRSIEITAPLSAEDMAVQAMDDASPTKWHLAHTTWFFETFILKDYLDGYILFDPAFNYCFNSYYELIGERHPRSKRGLLTRPSIDRIIAYREYVDCSLERLISDVAAFNSELARLVEIGINHEQQHQELMLTDILSLFAANPLRPAYSAPRTPVRAESAQKMRWVEFSGGLQQVGHDGNGFAWDNESPRHSVFIHPFMLADRLVTNAEWMEFMSDGGYCAPSLWQADGWTTINRENWRAPLYWEQCDGEWFAMSLEGLQPLDPQAPVAHVSYYEADAFARWSKARLPTEFEWETGAAMEKQISQTGDRRSTADDSALHGRARQMFGEVWQWTSSAHLPYPGYRPPAGALGEYNGKFMVGQHVVRGSSFATPREHARLSYRNFFYPHQRWQFLGLRLASEAL